MDPTLEEGLVQALNKMIGVRQVIRTDEIENVKDQMAIAKELDIDNIFEQFYQRICTTEEHRDDQQILPKPVYRPVLPKNVGTKKSVDLHQMPGVQFQICVMTLTGAPRIMLVTNAYTVENVKAMVHDAFGIPPDQQTLVYAGKRLENERTLAHYDINGNDAFIPTLHLVLVLRGGGLSHYYMSPEYFDRDFNYDFRKEKDNGKIYYRGEYVYLRPYGSMRYAIKVLGKYPDNEWLGRQGIRQGTDLGEWPVAYHGTLEMNAVGIVEDGFSLDKGRRFLFGKGIYATPNPLAALDYSAVYNFRGKNFKLIMQTRVDPSKLQVMETGYSDPKHAEYWLLPDCDAIRPYGICVYEIKN